jgi:hypothetical protein
MTGVLTPPYPAQSIPDASAGTLAFNAAVADGGRFLWTVGEDGTLNMVSDLPGIHRTIAADGEPVRAAGQITFRGGKVTSFDNWTGHYTSSPECAECFIQRGVDAFASEGIGIPRSVITDYGGGSAP